MIANYKIILIVGRRLGDTAMPIVQRQYEKLGISSANIPADKIPELANHIYNAILLLVGKEEAADIKTELLALGV